MQYHASETFGLVCWTLTSLSRDRSSGQARQKQTSRKAEREAEEIDGSGNVSEDQPCPGLSSHLAQPFLHDSRGSAERMAEALTDHQALAEVQKHPALPACQPS